MSAPPDPEAPILQARSAVLIDASTGTVLFKKAPDLEIPPASLSKLMTMHLAFKAVQSGLFSMDSPIPIEKEDCYPALPYRSSLMFLSGGMRVTLRKLMEGMAVPSGNDAAFAVARAISGSIEDFALAMTDEARSLGLSVTRFVEPSGLSEKNMTTAMEFAKFCKAYIDLHPEALAEFHSLKSLTFPLLENMPEGYSGPVGSIYQENRNSLLWNYPGCDGLKTGYIDESGYNIALTSLRDGTRLIAVILGGYGISTAEGSKTRADNGSRLLDYGFSHFSTARPAVGDIADVKVWKGRTDAVHLEAAKEVAITVRKADEGILRVIVRTDEDAIAPISRGQVLGEITVSAEGRILDRIPLAATEDIPKGNFLKRLWHSIILFFRGRRS